MSLSNVMKGGFANIRASYTLPEFLIAEKIISKSFERKEEKVKENSEFNRIAAEIIISKANEDAFLILDNAKREAELLLEEANKKSKLLYQECSRQGREEGYRNGFMQGNADAKEKMQEMIYELTAISDSLTAEKDNYLNTNKNLILDLASDIARKIVGENFLLGEDAFYTIFEQVVKKIPAAEKLTITISEQDYHMKSFDIDRIQKLASDFKYIEIYRDETEDAGTLKLETSIMLIDASLNSQIGLLKKEISRNSKAD